MNETYDMTDFQPIHGPIMCPMMMYRMDEADIERGMKPLQIIPEVIQELIIHPKAESTNVDLNILPKMQPISVELNIEPKIGSIVTDPIKLVLNIQPVMDPVTMKLMIEPMMQPMQQPMMMPCPITKHPCHMMMNPMAMQQPSVYPHENLYKNEESNED